MACRFLLSLSGQIFSYKSLKNSKSDWTMWCSDLVLHVAKISLRNSFFFRHSFQNQNTWWCPFIPKLKLSLRLNIPSQIVTKLVRIRVHMILQANKLTFLIQAGKKPYDCIYNSTELKLLHSVSQLPLNSLLAWCKWCHVVIFQLGEQEEQVHIHLEHALIQHLHHSHIQDIFLFLNIDFLSCWKFHWHVWVSPLSPASSPLPCPCSFYHS